MAAPPDRPVDPPPIRRVCVYCASSTPENPALVEAARALGHSMARRGIGLVYGGGSVGLMGVIADSVMNAGGEALGVIPAALFPVEVAHAGLTELIEVDSMHDRKAEMIRLSDAFVALPGGFGTLEEMAEVLTWAQLGLHAKPVGLLNADGFFDDLLAFFERCISERVLKQRNRAMLLVETDAERLLDALATYHPATEPKWFDLDQI